MPCVPNDLKGRNFTRIADWNRSELETLLDLRRAKGRAGAPARAAAAPWANDRAHLPQSASLQPYRVDAGLLALADLAAVAMHCLPAHLGEEITADVLYGPRCLAWEQAENRLHTQKALMALVIR
jgi:ornithine carbamoyltransferase